MSSAEFEPYFSSQTHHSFTASFSIVKQTAGKQGQVYTLIIFYSNKYRMLHQPESQDHLSPQHSSPDRSPRYTTCPICLLTTNRTLPFHSCNHHFCIQCLLNHCRHKLEQFQSIQCPSDLCSSQLNASSPPYTLLTPLEQLKVDKHIQFQLLAGNPSLRSCKKEECLGVFPTQKGRVEKCSLCLAEHCGKCHQLSHSGQCEQDVATALKRQELYIQCKKCRNMVERNGGCTHMTCRCGFEFCYYCGEDIKGHVCKGKEECMEEIMWNLREERMWFQCQEGFTLKKIFDCFRFSRASSSLEKAGKLLLFLGLFYPLLLVGLIVVIGVCTVGLMLVIIAAPFLLIGNHQTIQCSIKNSINGVVAIILVLLLYPLFFLYSMGYLIYRNCKHNKLRDLKIPFQRAVVVTIMPCLLVNY